MTDTRDSFEKWCISTGCTTASMEKFQYGEDLYVFPQMQAKWEAWQAALQAGAGDAHVVPAGWTLVPIEPNWDMRNEGREFLIDGIEKDYEKIAYFLWKTMVNASPKAPDARPPVAGLAELTDEKIVCLYDAMHRAEVLTMQRKENALGQMHGVDKAVIEAAREFLGKVE